MVRARGPRCSQRRDQGPHPRLAIHRGIDQEEFQGSRDVCHGAGSGHLRRVQTVQTGECKPRSLKRSFIVY